MLKLLQAHGLDAGPTQRPLLAGAVGGVIATVPALGILIVFQSLNEPTRAAGTSVVCAAGAYVGLMLLGGVLYRWLFQRAANDPRGGWLFGLAFGFIVWMLGPVPLLQWLPDEPVLRGYPAAGLLSAQLVWGLTLGMVFPLVHRSLHDSLKNDAEAAHGGTGPEAAAQTQMFRPLPSTRRSSL